MTTAIYCRISEDRQDGAGVERQLADCRRLVEGPAEEFLDPSISAFSGKVRPAYARLLEAVKRGEIDRIVCWKFDRLYRQPRELEALLDLAESSKLTIQAVMVGPIDLATSTGRTMARVVVAFSNQASEDTRDRVKRQKKQAKEQGKLLGGRTTFGWVNTTTPNPEQVVLLNEVVDNLLAGSSLNDEARRLNTEGVPTPQGRRDSKKTPVAPDDWKPRWTPFTVRAIVSNVRHIGTTIDAKKWHELQALLLRRSVYVRVPRRRSLLTGLVTCSLCGSKMVRTGSGPGRHAWRCPNPRDEEDKRCGKVSIGAEGLENLLVEATLLHADKGDLARIVKKMGSGGEQDKVLAELEALNAREDEMSVSFGRGELPMSAFNKATTALAAERQALTSRLGRLTSASVINPYLGKPGLLRASWAGLTIDQQREIIRLILGKVEVTPARKRGLPKFDPKRVRIA
jgi:DNA invertase Pin-like site-specific DNA recombinase